MKLRDEWVSCDSGGAAVRAYQAGPDFGNDPLPAIVVIMEIWGVDRHIQDLKAAGKSSEPHVYPGAPHAFVKDERRSFRLGPSRDAWARTLAFFAQHLAGA